MEDPVHEAYRLIFGLTANCDLKDWQIAEAVLCRFETRTIGKGLARQVVLRIVNHVQYPDSETCTRIVERAEGFAAELWDELPDEPHMAQLEWLEYRDACAKGNPKR